MPSSTSLPPKTLRVSVVQTCTGPTLGETLDKVERLARVAKERDQSQLVVFPEALIGSYPKMANFGTDLSAPSPAQREEYLRYHEAAIELPTATTPSAAVTRLEAISRQLDLFLIVGVIERDGGTLYCNGIFVDPKDGYLGNHRKLTPVASEKLVWGIGDGSTLPVLDKTFDSPKDDNRVSTKIAIALCMESYLPLLRQYYYSKNTQIYCAPTINDSPGWQHTMVHVAIEGRCFVLAASQYAQEKDYPLNPASTDPENVVMSGGSVIINPFGQILAGPSRNEECVLTAEIDLNDVIRAKFDLDVAGHYARPDVFKLTVNTSP